MLGHIQSSALRGLQSAMNMASMQRAPMCMAHRQPHRACTVRVASYSNNAAPSQRVYSKYSIYKGKGAVQFKPIPPTWKVDAKGSYSLDREGVVLLEFANLAQQANGRQGYGERSYAWDNKITFAMKPAELGALLDYTPSSTKPMELYHDPDKNTPQEGSQRKQLKISTSQDGNYMISMNLSSKTDKSYVAVPVTTAEMSVIKTFTSFLIPRLLGFDMVCERTHVAPQGSSGAGEGEQ